MLLENPLALDACTDGLQLNANRGGNSAFEVVWERLLAKKAQLQPKTAAFDEKTFLTYTALDVVMVELDARIAELLAVRAAFEENLPLTY